MSLFKTLIANNNLKCFDEPFKIEKSIEITIETTIENIIHFKKVLKSISMLALANRD